MSKALMGLERGVEMVSTHRYKDWYKNGIKKLRI